MMKTPWIILKKLWKRRDICVQNNLKETQKNTVPDAICIENSALNAPPGARTLDTLIKSQVLYQLS